jgi:hypothetical protein
MDDRLTDQNTLIRHPESTHAWFNLAQSGKLQDA